MLFNSGEFLRFFAAFLLLYWLVRSNLRARNILILAASYVFYGAWNYKFLVLIWASTLLDFFIGVALPRASTPSRRRWLLIGSIGGNLSILGFFKYYNFFAESLADMGERLGWTFHPGMLEVALPIGISFYTFQTLSYMIDVYRGTLKPTRNVIDFAAYVAFFPQLVAGPIERARHLLPQFSTTRRITSAMVGEGVWLCIWGMFKKVVVADNLAPLVDLVYAPSAAVGAGDVLLGTAAFGLQIYCDFSGYSDLARGLACLLGFDIMVNFDRPYGARNIRQFWQRWHISLSSWLRDYLYISLGGNRRGALKTARNLFLTMVLGGLWHGAAWHFVLWGAYHGTGLVLQRLWSQRFASRPAIPSPLKSFAWWTVTMAFVMYGWLLFRATSWDQIATLTHSTFSMDGSPWTLPLSVNLVVFSLPLVLMEIWQSRAKDRVVVMKLGHVSRGFLQAAMILAIVMYWGRAEKPFIYFQF